MLLTDPSPIRAATTALEMGFANMPQSIMRLWRSDVLAHRTRSHPTASVCASWDAADMVAVWVECAGVMRVGLELTADGGSVPWIATTMGIVATVSACARMVTQAPIAVSSRTRRCRTSVLSTALRIVSKRVL